MKRVFNATIILFILLVSGTLTAQKSNGYKLLVHKTNTIEKLSRAELSKLFLKKRTKWENDQKILPVDLKDSDAVRTLFSNDIHEKSVPAIKAYWQKQIFTGKGVPPPELNSYEKILDYIEENAGGIGYIPTSVSIKNRDLKVLKITD